MTVQKQTLSAHRKNLYFLTPISRKKKDDGGNKGDTDKKGDTTDKGDSENKGDNGNTGNTETPSKPEEDKPTRTDASVKVSSKTVTMSSKAKNLSDLVTTDGKIACKSSDPKTVKISGNKFIALKPGKVTLTISAEQGQKYNALPKTKITITVKPLAAKATVKSSAKGQVKVSWKAVKSVSGYQIQYSTSATMKNEKSITAKSAERTVTLRKMTSKKNYYIRIRTYKTVNGKKYYSNWSTVQKIKVK